MTNNIKFKTLVKVFSIILLTLLLARPWIERGLSHSPSVNDQKFPIDFVDDSGYRIRMEKPADSIISLYSAHTENLFSLGLDREIVGVGTSDIYPAAALDKEVFDYKSDPEKIIAKKPDVVLIRPFIERNSPDFVNSLRRSGITVVSLYPEKFEEFDDYIMKLALITGKEETAMKKLESFHNELEAIRSDTAGISGKVRVYFESSDRDYTTVTTDSMPAYAIKSAGGVNVANDAVAAEEGSSIASYGIEKILQKSDQIDVYVTQRGAMGGGGNTHSISIRPGFDSIKAVKNNRVVEINQKIISSPTFRFTKGVRELTRAFYPDVYDSLDYEMSDCPITRSELAEVMIKYTHSPIFIPTTSYYKQPERSHYYGRLQDVDTDDAHFDFIETCLQKDYFEVFTEDDNEYFHPNENVSRDELAKILYLVADLKNDDSTSVSDIENASNPRIVKSVVSSDLLALSGGCFEPERGATWAEVLGALEKLQVGDDNMQ